MLDFNSHNKTTIIYEWEEFQKYRFEQLSNEKDKVDKLLGDFWWFNQCEILWESEQKRHHYTKMWDIYNSIRTIFWDMTIDYFDQNKDLIIKEIQALQKILKERSKDLERQLMWYDSWRVSRWVAEEINDIVW